MVRLMIAIVAALAMVTANAYSEEDAILVLDASGSMWGQIDGEAKIVTARKVIGGLLDDLPDSRKLGLVAYGHNRKGDCADIEEIAPVGADRNAIRSAVNGLNPKGKTPLSASVKFAAEKLKHTENKATVILISDGKETCDLDPCEVGAELEKTGVDFTAHVIGFNITDEQDRIGLQCLAENTGGKYLNASNADELSGALTETVVEAPPARTTGLALRATELKGGPVIEEGLAWKVQQAGGGEVLFEIDGAGEAVAELPPGAYDIFVSRPSDGLKGEAKNVVLRPDVEKTVTIALELSFEATIRVEPEAAAPVSSEIIVYWTGPDRKSDYVTITKKGAAQGAYLDYEYTRQGNPLKLRMPAETGEYEARYVLGRPARVLASVPIEATAVEASLEAVDTIAAGADFNITWTGPGYNDDWITIVKPDAGERAYTDYAYTREGNPVSLRAPLEAGAYELRYLQAGKKILARRPITVTGVEASISGPSTAMAGTQHPISWTGPGGDRDWLTVVKPDARDGQYTDYKYMRKGNPLVLRMPLEPGDYELRYVQDGKKVIARQPITITAAQATISGPTPVKVGAPVSVEWTGPAESGDWLTITKPDERENRYTSYQYPAKKGNPLTLTAPLEPGAYEYRYVLNGKKVVARQAVTVEDISATVKGPASTVSGSDVVVEWTGPAYHRDFVTIAKPDDRDNRYTSYKYPRNGSPLTLKAPSEPGAYEIRYVLGGKRVVARQPLTVTGGE